MEAQSQLLSLFPPKKYPSWVSSNLCEVDYQEKKMAYKTCKAKKVIIVQVMIIGLRVVKKIYIQESIKLYRDPSSAIVSQINLFGNKKGPRKEPFINIDFWNILIIISIQKKAQSEKLEPKYAIVFFRETSVVEN